MPSDAQLLATAERRKEVLQLREAGATWEAIAETLESRHGTDALPSGWDKRYAWQDFQRELDKMQTEVEDRAKRVREMELKRLNRMQRALWEDALDGDTDAIRTIIRLMDRRADLLGMDEPDELDATVNGGRIDWSSVTDEQLDRVLDEGEPLGDVLTKEQIE
jgi:hypothetical protein